MSIEPLFGTLVRFFSPPSHANVLVVCTAEADDARSILEIYMTSPHALPHTFLRVRDFSAWERTVQRLEERKKWATFAVEGLHDPDDGVTVVQAHASTTAASDFVRVIESLATQGELDALQKTLQVPQSERAILVCNFMPSLPLPPRWSLVPCGEIMRTLHASRTQYLLANAREQQQRQATLAKALDATHQQIAALNCAFASLVTP